MSLLEEISTSNTHLLDHLLKEDILDQQELKKLQAKSTDADKNAYLLSLISRSSNEQYRRFVEILGKTGHEHVVQSLDPGNQQCLCNIFYDGCD